MIMGSARSGTTWLGKIFDSHPDTFYSHEPDTARRFREIPLLVPVESRSNYHTSLVTQVRALQDVRSLRVVGKMPLFRKSYTTGFLRPVRSAGFYLLKGSSRFLGETSAPRFLAGSPRDASCWVWKSIESTGRLGVLARVFSDAKILLLVRHPCGVIASLLKGSATTQFTGARTGEDLGFFQMLAETDQARSRGLGLEEFRGMSPLERLAWKWALLNEKTMQDIEGLSNCRTVRYEDLCADPVSVSKALLNFAGLKWHEQTELFVRSSTTQTKDAYYSVFKDPLVSASKWKEQLPPESIKRILTTVANTKPGRLYSDL